MATVSYSDTYLKSKGALDVPHGMMVAVYDVATDGALAQNDIWEAFSIPAGTVVTEVGLIVQTTDGITLDVGYTGELEAFIDGAACTAGLSFNSASLGNGSGSAETKSGGQYYSSADTIDVKFLGAAVDTAKIMLWCRYFSSKAG